MFSQDEDTGGVWSEHVDESVLDARFSYNLFNLAGEVGEVDLASGGKSKTLIQNFHFDCPPGERLTFCRIKDIMGNQTTGT